MSKEVEKNDAALADVGWRRMEALLDKEMPTRRRFILWWALSGVAVVALVASVLLAQQNDDVDVGMADRGVITQNERIGENPSSDVATIEMEDQTGAFDDGTEKNIGGVDAKKGAAKITEELSSKVPGTSGSPGLQEVASTTPAYSTGSQKGSGTKNSVDILSRPADPELEKNIDLKKDVETHLDAESTAVNVHREGEGRPSVEGDPVPGDSRQQYLIRSLHSEMHELFVAPAPLYTSLTDFQMIQPIRAESEKRWQASVEVGGLMDGTGQKFSWDIGARLGFQIAKNLSLSSGAYIWSIADNEDFSFAEGLNSPDLVATNDTFEPEMAPIADTITFVSNDQSRWGRTRRITYLRIPVYISLFPNGKWSPYAGVSYLKLLSNKTSGSQDALASRLIQRNEITDLVRTSNLTLDLGIRYRPIKHLNIGLSYIHGTQSYLNYEIGGGGVPAIHRTWRLSLGYQF